MVFPIEEKREFIDWKDSNICISKQCELLKLSKGALYYKPVKESEENLILMDLIDQQYLKTPFYGSRKFVAHLKQKGHIANRKKVQRLMRKMGIEAIYPKINLSKRNHAHKVFPYLLRGLDINKPNMVWATDITYIRLCGGYLYLMAVIDWFSKLILSWRLSNTLSTDFCIEGVQEALRKGKPEIFNTDQGVQFTSKDFTKLITKTNILMSMDGKGRALDNIIIERFWRSLKYEEVYLNEYIDVASANDNIGKYMKWYNIERPHQTLKYLTPEVVHNGII